VGDARAHRREVLERLAKIRASLGEDVRRYTLVGGSVPALIAPAHVGIRETHDVDLIVEAQTWHDYQQACAHLQDLGAKVVPHEHAARMSLAGVWIDLMPTAYDAIGNNSWYPSAFANREYHLESGWFVVSDIDFLATKVEAFRSRGAIDPLSSHDLEDIVRLLTADDALSAAVEASDRPAARYVRFELSRLAGSVHGEEQIAAHAEPDAGSQERVHDLWLRLCRW